MVTLPTRAGDARLPRLASGQTSESPTADSARPDKLSAVGDDEKTGYLENKILRWGCWLPTHARCRQTQNCVQWLPRHLLHSTQWRTPQTSASQRPARQMTTDPH